jgi:hypothetical protein
MMSKMMRMPVMMVMMMMIHKGKSLYQLSILYHEH